MLRLAMPPYPSPDTPPLPQTTRWTMLEALHGKNAEEAWTWFVDRYRPYVRNILVTALQSPAHAHQAENEFWGYVYLQDPVRRADRARRFRTYLAGVVRNFARSYKRRLTSPEGSKVAQSGPATDEAVLQRELSLWTDMVVQLSMRTLREEMPKAATAIETFYGIGQEADKPTSQSTTEVAKLLQCNPAAVYQLLSRGRKRLRELIQQELMEGCSDAKEMDEELDEVLANLGRRHPGMLDA